MKKSIDKRISATAALVQRYTDYRLPDEIGAQKVPVKLYSYYVKQKVILGKNPGKHTVGCVVLGQDPATGKWCRGVSIASPDEVMVGKGYGKYEAFKRWMKAVFGREHLEVEPFPNSEAGSRFISALTFYGEDFKERNMSVYDATLNPFEEKIIKNNTR
jgi:hypothetical protein